MIYEPYLNTFSQKKKDFTCINDRFFKKFYLCIKNI